MNCQEIITTLRGLQLEAINDEVIIELVKIYPRTGAIITTFYPAIGQEGVPNLYVRATNYDPAQETVNSTDR